MRPAFRAGLGLLAAAVALVAVAADVGHDFLPPALVAQAVLAQRPSVRAAAAGVVAAAARRDRLLAGPHEWTWRVGVQRRREDAGGRYAEQELSLERAFRIGDKAGVDRRIGDATVQAGQLAWSDAWHEAARGLLADWFEALRDARAASVLEAQARLAAQQRDLVARRVQAGEAPRMDLLAAEAEAQRTAAAAAQVAERAAAGAAELARRYPGLPVARLAAPGQVPLPPLDARPPQTWVERLLADNHEIEWAEAQAQRARLEAQRATLERSPDPVVGVRASRERGGAEQVLGVYLSVPLGPAGRHADAALALAEADRAEQEALGVRARVSTEAWKTVHALTATHAHWERQERVSRQMAAHADLAARAYALGESALSDVLAARRLALEAALVTEQAWLDAVQARWRLQLDLHGLWAPAGHGAGEHP